MVTFLPLLKLPTLSPILSSDLIMILISGGRRTQLIQKLESSHHNYPLFYLHLYPCAVTFSRHNGGSIKVHGMRKKKERELLCGQVRLQGEVGCQSRGREDTAPWPSHGSRCSLDWGSHKLVHLNYSHQSLFNKHFYCLHYPLIPQCLLIIPSGLRHKPCLYTLWFLDLYFI